MRDTIKKHEDFLPGENDINAQSEFFYVRGMPTKFPGDARYGITATKRTFKLAVHRNRAKRLLRDWIRHHEDLLCDNLDYVFVARHGILNATRDAGRTAMRKALAYIKKINATKK